MELTCPITTKLEIYIPDHYVLDTICCITSEWLCDLEFGVESYVVCRVLRREYTFRVSSAKLDFLIQWSGGALAISQDLGRENFECPEQIH